MRTLMSRLCASVVLVLLCGFVPGTSAVGRSAQMEPATTPTPRATSTPTATTTPPATTPAPSLHLSVDRGGVAPGQLVTLTVAYTNLGLQHTTITISPAGVLAFDPPVAMPCKYDQHPTQCTSFTLRAAQAGAATIRASATGEIYDDGCSCWVFSSAADDGPAVVVVGGSRRYLPLVQR